MKKEVAVFHFFWSFVGILMGIFLAQNAFAMARSLDICDPQILGGPPPLFSGPETQKIMDWDEQNNGVGKMIPKLPENVTDVFINGVDLPGDKLLLQAEKSKKEWIQLSPELQKSMLKIKMDPALIQDFNLVADSIWQEMLACNGGDVERLRMNYFKGQPCGSLPSSEEIISKIKQLQKSFIETNYSGPLFIRDKVGANSEMEIKYNRCEFSGDTEKFESMQIELPMFHPLFSQVLIQSLAAVNNTFVEKLQQSTLDMITVDDEVLCENYDPDYKPRYSGEAKPYTKLVMNIFVLIGSQTRDAVGTIESCGAFGLWPMANRANLYLGMLTRVQNISGIYPFIQQNEKRMDKACSFDRYGGRKRIDPIGASRGGIYSRIALATIFESKRLFATYFDPKMDIPANKTLQKNLKEAPFEVLSCK